jgi:hypothetical protein
MTGVGFIAMHTQSEGYRDRTNSKKKSGEKTKRDLCGETAKMRSEERDS